MDKKKIPLNAYLIFDCILLVILYSFSVFKKPEAEQRKALSTALVNPKYRDDISRISIFNGGKSLTLDKSSGYWQLLDDENEYNDENINPNDDEKLFGIFMHRVMNRKVPLVRGFDDAFYMPHSRHTETPADDIHNCEELVVLAESDKAGIFLCMNKSGSQIFVMGHAEYDRLTLDQEYRRDLSKNLPIHVPENYYPDDNPDNKPDLLWRSHANNLYTNWLNYYVYQNTPYKWGQILDEEKIKLASEELTQKIRN